MIFYPNQSQLIKNTLKFSEHGCLNFLECYFVLSRIKQYEKKLILHPNQTQLKKKHFSIFRKRNIYKLP